MTLELVQFLMCSPAGHGVAINVVSSHWSGSADQTLSVFGFDFHTDGCHSTLVSAFGFFLEKKNPQVTRVSSMVYIQNVNGNSWRYNPLTWQVHVLHHNFSHLSVRQANAGSLPRRCPCLPLFGCPSSVVAFADLDFMPVSFCWHEVRKCSSSFCLIIKAPCDLSHPCANVFHCVLEVRFWVSRCDVHS